MSASWATSRRTEGAPGGGTAGTGPSRREALVAAGGLASLALPGCGPSEEERGGSGTGARPNVLVLTVDDMDYGSVGACGSPLDATPHIDRLASEGTLFTNAHVTASSCKPSRQSFLTGRVPHRYGEKSWGPIAAGLPTLPGELGRAGYRTGLLGKVEHHEAVDGLAWDDVTGAQELRRGRDPERFRNESLAFFERARDEGRPFFLLANSSDPHRPFPGSPLKADKWAEEDARWRAAHPEAEGPSPYVPPAPPRTFDPGEVPVPGFLPDVPGVRLELAQYFAGVSRADAFVGAVLEALSGAGLAGTTLVVFFSDNGMALPFAKGNVYRHSTRTPLIVRWPGVASAGRRVERLVSGVDLMPTLLESAGVATPPNGDGSSFLASLEGAEVPGPEHLYTYFDDTLDGEEQAMRAVQTSTHGYVVNLWWDGARTYSNMATNGIAMQAMRNAAASDEDVAERLRHYRRRAREELYDYASDPFARVNLADRPEHRKTRDGLRAALLAHMEATADPGLQEAKRRP